MHVHINKGKRLEVSLHLIDLLSIDTVADSWQKQWSTYNWKKWLTSVLKQVTTFLCRFCSCWETKASTDWRVMCIASTCRREISSSDDIECLHDCSWSDVGRHDDNLKRVSVSRSFARAQRGVCCPAYDYSCRSLNVSVSTGVLRNLSWRGAGHNRSKLCRRWWS